MAVPKRKTSKARRDKRRSPNMKKALPGLSICPQCHEEALDMIKEICEAAEMEVIGAGNIKRMEDVKKLLYAGCRRAVLDYTKESNIAITEEVSLKFGRNKILASYDNANAVAVNKELLEQYVSALLLMNPHQIRETEKLTTLPFYVQVNQIALNKLMEIFSYKNVCGVTGIKYITMRWRTV